jgi:hypothetical protein
VQLKPEVVGKGTKLVTHPSKVKRTRVHFSKQKGTRTSLTEQERQASAAAQEGGRVGLGRTKKGVNGGLRFYREKVRPKVKDDLKKVVKTAVQTALPVAATTLGGPAGAAFVANNEVNEGVSDLATDSLGRLTGAYGVAGRVTQGLPSGTFRNDFGTLTSLNHAATRPSLPTQDFSKPNPTLVGDPGVVKYKRGGPFRVN